MNKNTLTRLALAALSTNLLVGCLSGDNLEGEVAFPRTCAEAVQGRANANDGPRMLYVDGDEAKPWQAYCADVDGDAKEYLNAKDSPGNYSMYRAGGQSPGTDVMTHYEKIRIDPINLRLDVTDQTFAVSTGSVMHLGSTKIESMPLGVAMTCGGGSAWAQVDVSDTPFIVVGSFQIDGNGAQTGHASPWHTNQVVELGADGDCGWVVPTGLDPMKAENTSIALSYEK